MQNQTNNSYAFLIPVYNHGKQVVNVINTLSTYGLPFIVVDDGSNAETKEYLSNIKENHTSVSLITLEKNSGKGAAVCAGIKYAYKNGFDYILQVDADGQHDLSCCNKFIEKSKNLSEAMICGIPEYDESVPLSRKNGRKFGNTMAKIVTLSNDIQDAMCGFRVYPVKKTYVVINKTLCLDYRMAFDLEILIKLKWKNVPFHFMPVHITYPEDGLSHFHMVKDNLRITWMFTRTFFGMIIRLPILLFRKITKTEKKV